MTGPFDATALEQIARAADANLATHVSWAMARTPGMRVIESDDLVIADSGQPCDTFNCICRARLSVGSAPERARAAIEMFAQAAIPFSWWVGPVDRPANLRSILRDAGLVVTESAQAMVIDLGTLGGARPVDGVEIQRVHTADALMDFAAVVAANWSPPDVEVVRFYDRVTPAILAPGCPQRFYVGYLDGEAIATAEVTVTDDVAGLYGVCTRALFRHRGIASHVTWRALCDARDAGCRIGVLQASAAGAGAYERLGFRTYGTVTEYQPARSSPTIVGGR